MIFFINSKFILSSRVNIYFMMLKSVVFSFQYFQFQTGKRLLFIFFMTYMSIYFLYLYIRKSTFLKNHSSFVSKSLTCCIKFSGICPNFYHSFSQPSLCRISLKITTKYISLVFTFLCFVILYKHRNIKKVVNSYGFVNWICYVYLTR